VGLYTGAITFDDPNFHRRKLTLYASRNSLPSTFEEIIALMASGKIHPHLGSTDALPWTILPQSFPKSLPISCFSKQ
jgi:threonine dehydrogenase-like Zn-dependent dehydrogenase